MSGPAAWNSLPLHVRQSQCLATLKKQRRIWSRNICRRVRERGDGGGGGGGERRWGGETDRQREEKGYTTSELCIIVQFITSH